MRGKIMLAIVGTAILISLLFVLSQSSLFHARDGGNGGGSGGIGGGSEKIEGEGKIVVVVTIPPQAEFVRRVGGENVVVDTMIAPDENPHVYEPKPSQLMNLSKAKMYAMVGSGMEFERIWMDKIRDLNRNMLIVNCSDGINLLSTAQNSQESGRTDPHVWLSPRNAEVMVRNICEGLIQIDPANRSYYERNMNEYIQELKALDIQISETLSHRKCRKILVYHPAWTYFARDYGLEQIPIEEEGKEPTPEKIKRIIEIAKKENITTVFVSPQLSTDSVRVIADAIGGKVVFVNPLAENYVENMKHIAEVIAYS